jgi:hypothetical protein
MSSPRRWLVAALIVLVLGASFGAGLIHANSFGLGDKFERFLARVERLIDPPPAEPVSADVEVTARPTAAPTPTTGPRVTQSPSEAPGQSPDPATPSPSATLAPPRVAVDVDILAKPKAVFASELKNTWCAPAGIQMTLAVLGLADTSDATQREIAGRVREWDSYSDSHNGDWGPSAMAQALAAYGAPGYQVRVYDSRADALYDSARAISQTGSPVILLAWRGAHTWVMTGYRADADPALFDDAKVSGAYILDPWYPRVSSIWGPSDPPGTFEDAAEMKRNFLPWKRPEGKYPKRDGKFVVLIPTVSMVPAG